MARGYPDYFGVSTFPRYGAYTTEFGTHTFMIGEANYNIFDTIVKGRIYGGYLTFVSGGDISNVGINITYDGHYLSTLSLKILYDQGFYRDGMASVYITEYNPGGKKFAIGFSGGITFDTSFKVTIYNTPLIAFDVNGYIVYSIVKE